VKEFYMAKKGDPDYYKPALKELEVDVTCPHCGQVSVAEVVVRLSGFNEAEAAHCAWCGLRMEDLRVARPPTTRRKEVPGGWKTD
jgi:transcription elongation factor Elf1